jgi:hypothetical protein
MQEGRPGLTDRPVAELNEGVAQEDVTARASLVVVDLQLNEAAHRGTQLLNNDRPNALDGFEHGDDAPGEGDNNAGEKHRHYYQSTNNNDTRQPHGIASASDKPAEILTLFSAQGEQIHIRDE